MTLVDLDTMKRLLKMGLSVFTVFTDNSTDYGARDSLAQGKIQSAAKLSRCYHLCLL